MKAILSLVLLCTSVAAGQTRPSQPKPAAPPCAIEGVVVRSDGAPIKNASVTAVPQRGSSAEARSARTVSDANGKFLIDELKAGLYLVEAHRANFLRQRYGQRKLNDSGVPISVVAGQRLKDIVLQLQPAAVISGRIVDEDTEAIVGARVSALRWGYRNGHKDLVSAAVSITDDRGEYRIHQLPPGRYFLSASLEAEDGAVTQASAGKAGSAATAQGVYVPTFYPGSSDLAGANVVELQPGDQASNISFRLITVPGTRVSGYVRHAWGEAARGVGLMLTPRQQSGQGTYGPGLQVVSDREGNFEFTGVFPGPYFLTCSGSDGDRPSFARLELQVGNAEVNRLILVLQPAVDIPAETKIDMADASKSSLVIRSLRLSFDTVDGLTPTITASFDRTRASLFLFRNVLAGDYTLRVSGLADDLYLDSVRVGGREAQDNIVQVRGRVSTVEVVIGNNPGEIEGSVLDENDRSYAGATVVLVPDEPRRKRFDLYKTISTDQVGYFRLRGIAPGTYKMFAWDEVDADAYQDPEFLSAFEGRGSTIEISPKQHVSLQLRLISEKQK